MRCFRLTLVENQYQPGSEFAVGFLDEGANDCRSLRNNLQNWLEEHLNGAVVQGGVKKVTNDETGIEIRVHGESKFYIIEVKWLGIGLLTKGFT